MWHVRVVMWSRLVAVVSLPVMLAVAGCDTQEDRAAAPAPGAANPGPAIVQTLPLVTHALRPVSVDVVVRQPRATEPAYEEGFVTFFALIDGEGRWVPSSAARGARRVPAGHYEVRAGVNPCDGNCSVLDGVGNSCRLPVDLTSDATVVVQLHTTRACELRVIPSR